MFTRKGLAADDKSSFGCPKTVNTTRTARRPWAVYCRFAFLVICTKTTWKRRRAGACARQNAGETRGRRERLNGKVLTAAFTADSGIVTIVGTSKVYSRPYLRGLVLVAVVVVAVEVVVVVAIVWH